MARVNIQARARAYLADALGVPVVVSVPDPRPQSFVLVMRSGGGRSDAVRDIAGLDVEAWAATEAEASALMYEVADLMEAFEHEQGIARVDEETMRSDRDIDTMSPRWYASYTITTYRNS